MSMLGLLMLHMGLRTSGVTVFLDCSGRVHSADQILGVCRFAEQLLHSGRKVVVNLRTIHEIEGGALRVLARFAVQNEHEGDNLRFQLPVSAR